MGRAVEYYQDIVLKPKPENYPKDKFWTKGRLICSTNAFAHAPCHMLVSGCKRSIMGRTGHVEPDVIIPILGQDPSSFIKKFIDALVRRGQVPSSAKGAYYFVYSDNIYIYSISSSTFYSLDGVKMES